MIGDAALRRQRFCGGNEILPYDAGASADMCTMNEGKMYADKLKAPGVAVRYRNYDRVTHEFFGMGGVVPEAKDAVKGLIRIPIDSRAPRLAAPLAGRFLEARELTEIRIKSAFAR